MSLNLDEKSRIEEVMRLEEDFWAKYVGRSNSMKTNAGGILRRLNELSPKLFSQPEKMQFDIMDIASKFAERLLGMQALARR